MHIAGCVTAVPALFAIASHLPNWHQGARQLRGSMTDEPPKKKSLAGLGQMLEKAAAREKADAENATGSAGDSGEKRGYEITFRKKSSP